jgi:hypothetical protein
VQLAAIQRPIAWFGRWVLRSEEIRTLRASLPARDQRRQRAFGQASLLVEVARRVAEPVERLPSGSRPAVMVGLYRDAISWALLSARPEDGAGEPDLERLLDELPRERLVEIAGDAAALESVKATLRASRSLGAAMDATKEDVARLRGFAEGLVVSLDQPRRRIQKLRLLRWGTLAAIAAALVLAVYGIYRLGIGPNLLANKPFRTSSSWTGCSTDSECGALLFHTDPEMNPWVEFDFGKPTTFRRIEISNRVDCCSERTVPLVVEISSDRTRWTEVARRDTDFSDWTIKTPPKTARYLKLRVTRHTVFHLKSVAVR